MPAATTTQQQQQTKIMPVAVPSARPCSQDCSCRCDGHRQPLLLAARPFLRLTTQLGLGLSRCSAASCPTVPHGLSG